MSAMVEGAHISEARGVLKKRKIGNKKSHKSKKKVKMFQGSGEKVKVDRKMKKLFRKRAREYNSDDDDDDNADKSAPSKKYNAYSESNKYDKRNIEAGKVEEEPEVSEDEDEDEDNEDLPTITKFTEGCRAFRVAFKSIIKKSASDDVLVSSHANFLMVVEENWACFHYISLLQGPILSGQKKLVAQKLAEEESEKKLKGEAKKEKLLVYHWLYCLNRLVGMLSHPFCCHVYLIICHF